jgi:serine/threonine protein kinase
MENVLNLDNINFAPNNIREYYFDGNEDFKGFVSAIDKKLKYFFIITENDINLIENISETGAFFCSFLFGYTDEGKCKYLCSYKYFYLKNKLYKYNKNILSSFEKETYVLDTGNYIVKYTVKNKTVEKSNSFFNDTLQEKDVLEELNDENYEFIEKQKLLSYEITDHYIIIVKKKINGEVFKKKHVESFTLENKINILKQIVQQLSILEKHGYIYNDLRSSNFMIEDKSKNVYLIDLGSITKSAKSKRKYTEISRGSCFNVLDCILIIVYNLFNLSNDFFNTNSYASNKKYKLYSPNNYDDSVKDLVVELVNKNRTFSEINDYINTVQIKNGEVKCEHSEEEQIDLDFIEKIRFLFKDEITSVVDIQCASYLDIQYCAILKNKDIMYIGTNTDEHIVKENRQKMRYSKKNMFVTLDPISEPIPKTDLIVCYNYLKTISCEDIWLLLENIMDSDSKYLAIDYFYNQSQRLTEKPFYLPPPMFFVLANENSIMLAVYEISVIEMFLSPCIDTKLRTEIMRYFNKDLDKIYNAFCMYENGKKLFLDVMLDKDVDYDKYYYAENYKKIIDENNLFDKYVHLLIIKDGYSRENVERIRKESRYGYLINDKNFKFVSTILADCIYFRYKKYN